MMFGQPIGDADMMGRIINDEVIHLMAEEIAKAARKEARKQRKLREGLKMILRVLVAVLLNDLINQLPRSLATLTSIAVIIVALIDACMNTQFVINNMMAGLLTSFVGVSLRAFTKCTDEGAIVLSCILLLLSSLDIFIEVSLLCSSRRIIKASIVAAIFFISSVAASAYLGYLGLSIFALHMAIINHAILCSKEMMGTAYVNDDMLAFVGLGLFTTAFFVGFVTAYDNERLQATDTEIVYNMFTSILIVAVIYLVLNLMQKISLRASDRKSPWNIAYILITVTVVTFSAVLSVIHSDIVVPALWSTSISSFHISRMLGLSITFFVLFNLYVINTPKIKEISTLSLFLLFMLSNYITNEYKKIMSEYDKINKKEKSYSRMIFDAFFPKKENTTSDPPESKESDITQDSEPETDLQSPVDKQHRGLDIRRPGPGFCAEKRFVYTGQESDLVWEDCGIMLHFPATPCETNIEVSVGVVMIVDEKFILSDKREFVSAVYKITASDVFPAPVTVRMQHCVVLPQHDEAFLTGLTFVIAHDGPPYEFKALPGGRFSCESSYGEVELSEFSYLATVWWWLGWPMSFFVGVFYHQNITANFVVTKNLNAHISAVTDEYGDAVTVDKRSMMCDVYTKAIALYVPSTTSQEKGWKVEPLFKPAEIDMADIQQYEPGKTSPSVKLMMTWVGEGEPKQSEVEIKVTGGRFESFSLRCRPALTTLDNKTTDVITTSKESTVHQGVRLRHSVLSEESSGDEEQAITIRRQRKEHATVLTADVLKTKRSGKLELDRDLLAAREMLLDLSKAEIRALGLHLGLRHSTLNNYASFSGEEYLYNMVVSWINGKDNVHYENCCVSM